MFESVFLPTQPYMRIKLNFNRLICKEVKVREVTMSWCII